MSDIKASGCLFGYISGECELKGSLSCDGGLTGIISVPSSVKHEIYEGPCEITPDAFAPQILPTENKLLTQDVVVEKVPYYETSNNHDGVTVYIAEKVGED